MRTKKAVVAAVAACALVTAWCVARPHVEQGKTGPETSTVIMPIPKKNGAMMLACVSSTSGIDCRERPRPHP
jgi:hypothetical protein